MFRFVTKNDKSNLKNMMQEFYVSPAVHAPVPDSNFDKTFDQLMLQSPYAEAYIFEHHNSPAGYALLAKTWSNEAGGLVIWIEELYIREDYRGLGLGGEFLRYVKEFYHDKAARLRLEVEESNTGAIRLYSRIGYDSLPYAQMIIDF